MCGIYGTTKKYPDPIIRKKLESIQFRGPDFSGFKQADESVILGHNRLAIIDLDPRSNQPLQYEHLWIVFNGEVYNFQFLKKKLQERGYLFKTNSDTEVIIAAYLADGEKCVEQLNGMFAFVIYDTKNKIFFGARDRMGQKPLYYSLHGEKFEFASQIYPLSVANNFTLDTKSIQRYLFWKCMIEPDSIYQEIKKLKAGHCFRYDLEKHSFTEWKYWDIDQYQPFKGSYEDAKEQLHELLQDSVQKRMISDVPLGVFLSGGIDSSLIAAIAQASSNQPIKTFSVKFQENDFDESSYAKQIAQQLGTDHTTIHCNYKESLDLIENLADSYQEPFADSSAIPTSLLSKYTREHVTVALSGDAGDESFLGYDRYDQIKKAAFAFNFPGPIRQLVGAGLNCSSKTRHQLFAKAVRQDNINDLYIKLYSSLNDFWLLAPNDARECIYNEWAYSNKNLLERVSDLDLKIYLANDINTKVDRASMAYSLETRAPLEDHRIISFARSLPTEFKYYKGNKKRILKDVLYQYLPKELFDRPKMGFGMPLSIWFKGRLKDYLLDTLSESQLKKIAGISVPAVQQLIKEHLSGQSNRSSVLWTLIVLVNWLNKNGH